MTRKRNTVAGVTRSKREVGRMGNLRARNAREQALPAAGRKLGNLGVVVVPPAEVFTHQLTVGQNVGTDTIWGYRTDSTPLTDQALSPLDVENPQGGRTVDIVELTWNSTFDRVEVGFTGGVQPGIPNLDPIYVQFEGNPYVVQCNWNGTQNEYRNVGVGNGIGATLQAAAFTTIGVNVSFEPL